jgi:hypothetical protein
MDARTGIKNLAGGAVAGGHDEPYDPLVFALHAMMSLLVCWSSLARLARCVLSVRAPPPLPAAAPVCVCPAGRPVSDSQLTSKLLSPLLSCWTRPGASRSTGMHACRLTGAAARAHQS